ncbi:hypothetical protein V498_02561 [Pseudogymnoascus sp. VKM F-4517 (FW-2822)]|nr:hypothetical protein V498_02561 [Pseudogymnoascus sp. VKM F-4517 (FW-2822)]
MSTPSSGASTPNPRFKPQAKTAEDILSNQTVGLVNLSDFRKRRAEAIEQKERDAQESLLGSSRGGSGAATPVVGSGGSTPSEPPKKKPKRKAGTPKLSFGMDDEEDEGDSGISNKPTPKNNGAESRSQSGSPAPQSDAAAPKRKFAPNASIGAFPKALTKRSLLQESQAREALRKEFLGLQERVKAAPIAIPFVFYDGSNVPGGVCRVTKGDFVWKFLDGSRKVGAEVGAGVGGEAGKGDAKARREWAKVGVDDLMMVRGEIIIPPHYDFYYFIINKTLGPNKRLLFDYSAEAPPDTTPAPITSDEIPENYNPLSRPSNNKSATLSTVPIAELDGANDDPTFTKVVDRRWYERNKHIYPASVWQEFDPEKDYQTEVKRDVGGNAFFFS